MCDLPIDVRYGTKTICWWGMTETISHPVVGDAFVPNRPMSMGRPSTDHEVKVVRTDGERVEPEESGELEVRGVRGLSMFVEYLNRPGDTAEAFDGEGWFATGDLVTPHADGHLSFENRMGVGILVLVEIATSVALLFATDDPRLILLKPSLYTLVAAGYLYVTCLVGKPMVYQAATPVATGGDPVRLAAYREAWVVSAPFRRRERVLTAVFGSALLIEAVLRGVIIYALPADDVATALTVSQVPGIVLLAGALLVAKLQVPALSRVVDEIQERLVAGAPAAAAAR